MTWDFNALLASNLIRKKVEEGEDLQKKTQGFDRFEAGFQAERRCSKIIGSFNCVSKI